MKKTKIVCTIGPASDSEEILRRLMEEGMNVCRLNFSHGTQEEHKVRIDRIKKVREELNLPIGIMLDTKGPEIRLGVIKNDESFFLEVGDKYTLTTDEIEGDRTISSVSYKNLPNELKVGGRILIDDGLIELRVLDIEGSNIYTEVVSGGFLKSRKGVNIPDVNINLPALTEKDISDLKFAVVEGVDFIAASFIRSKEDVLEIRRVLEEEGEYSIKIISKIESKEGLQNIDEIISVSDGIMVARGDLGVEIETELVPLAQKEMIRKCNLAGKFVITATQMLDSMMRNPRPTRAEANDVANAVIDGSSAIMLSGETASGSFPVLSVTTMRKIAEATENSLDYESLLDEKITQVENTTTNAIGKSTCTIARDLSVGAIVTATTGGSTSRAISKFRPKAPIVAVTTSSKVRNQLSIEWGVYPIVAPHREDTDQVLEVAINESIKAGFVSAGDTVVLTAGVPVGITGTTNLIKVQKIGSIVGNGTGIGKYTVKGRALVVKNMEDLREFKEGDILVTAFTNKDMMEVVEKVSGIVTEEGGFTSHGAIVGLNLGISTIVGAVGIVDRITTGDLITLNTEEGIVQQDY